jgi:hypothetical protein
MCVDGASLEETTVQNLYGCWADFYMWAWQAYVLTDDSWDGAGISDACNVSLPFAKVLNSVYLINYALSDNYIPQWHSTEDYASSSRAADNRFHGPFYQRFIENDGSADATTTVGRVAARESQEYRLGAEAQATWEWGQAKATAELSGGSNASREDFRKNLGKETQSHVQKASSKRDVQVNTSYPVSHEESEETSLEREFLPSVPFVRIGPLAAFFLEARRKSRASPKSKKRSLSSYAPDPGWAIDKTNGNGGYSAVVNQKVGVVEGPKFKIQGNTLTVSGETQSWSTLDVSVTVYLKSTGNSDLVKNQTMRGTRFQAAHTDCRLGNDPSKPTEQVHQ